MRLFRFSSMVVVSLFGAACDDSGDSGGGDVADVTAHDTAATDTTANDTGGNDAADVATGPNWACLPSPAYPAPASATLDFPLKVIGAVGGVGVEGMSVKVCPGTDLACPAPVDTETTAADGTATVTLPLGEHGFVGFAWLTKADYVDTIAMANVPIVTPRTVPVNLDVIKAAELTLLTSTLGGTDPTRGHLLVGTWDCGLKPAPGVSVDITAGGDATTKRFYIVGSLPDVEATETHERGSAGFLNVPVGNATIATKRASDSAAIGTAVAPVVAGKITQVVIVPN